MHATLVVGMLALGASLGQIGAAIPLIVYTRRVRGKAAVVGMGRALIAGLSAEAAAAAVGVAACLVLPKSHKLIDAGDAVLATVCAIAVFSVVAYCLDKTDLRVLLAKARQLRGSLGHRHSDSGPLPEPTAELTSAVPVSKPALSISGDTRDESGDPVDQS